MPQFIRSFGHFVEEIEGVMDFGAHLEDMLVAAIVFYTQNPQWLLLISAGVIIGAVMVRSVTRVRWPDRVKREFRRAGIRATAEQVEMLREELAALAASEARQQVQEQLQRQTLLQRDKAQLERVTTLAQAHIAVVKEMGATLQALEHEYQRQCKSLNSEQTREALRLIVEKSVTHVTELTHASAQTLPTFTTHEPRG